MVGHTDLIGPEGWLRRMLRQKSLLPLILWGPPGVGKTTLAHLLAVEVEAEFVARSAVDVGVAELRKLLAEALERYRRRGIRTLLFLDEIHRFNKGQQDALLADLERGTVILVGATTENPAFSIQAALLSRAHVAVLGRLSDDEVGMLLDRACAHRDGVSATLTPEARAALTAAAQGDGRYALGLLEAAATLAAATGTVIAAEHVAEVARISPLRHDKTGDAHYDVVSAWIKSMRASKREAALYWGARLWEAGEDRRFLFRRLIIFASEDVGLADAGALPLAVAAAQGFERVGEAEGWILFAHAVAAMADAPKSKASYRGYRAAAELVARYGHLPVPLHLRNAPTALARKLGHGADYIDPHDDPEGAAAQSYFPEALSEPNA